jgi:glycosidase
MSTRTPCWPLCGVAWFAICLCFTTAASAVEPGDAIGAPVQPFPHPPAWVADQTLYEVNLRQFSDAGNVEGLTAQLPRLKDLGVGTLWLMPVNPIGVAGRSGKLGSPYAVQDYLQFNPELGTLDQFKTMIDRAHRLGMYVIMDWVAPHTALDHPWVHQHPDWYNHDAAGELVPPMPAWRDVAGLNYASPQLRREMIRCMAYWVREVGVDGFRCDSAEFVPLDFWCTARNALRKIKPVFMLAEGNNPQLVRYAFDAAYAWYLPSNMEGIVKGAKTVTDLTNFFKAEATLLSGDGFRLNYTSNHDKNAWEGTTRDLLDGGADAFTVLTFTAPGMPLIYNGQEAGVEHRMNFFDHDPIVWRDDPAAGLYRQLATLKRDNFALWDGLRPAPMQFISNPETPSVLTFEREFQGDRVLVILNLGAQAAHANVPPDAASMHVVLDKNTTPDDSGHLLLQAWGYRVWSDSVSPH